MWFNSNTEAPKILADGFEAIVGAVFLDGSWKAIHKFLGEVFCSFIFYFALYNNKMIVDIKSEIINFFTQRGIKCELETNGTLATIVITENGIK